jgi:hypothetical protein
MLSLPKSFALPFRGRWSFGQAVKAHPHVQYSSWPTASRDAEFFCKGGDCHPFEGTNVQETFQDLRHSC